MSAPPPPGGIILHRPRRNFLRSGKLMTSIGICEDSMRRMPSKPAPEPASQYHPLPGLPAAEHLRRFASACRDLAERESDPARQALFREMESAWEAIAAQIERTDDLLGKMRASRCQLN
ncbi:MAG: hypothetical protein JO084_06255 [Bradyrhizobiaceae bacterium]|nr:hypothetical protein [Hyphomicrobiales bacterium]MBV9427304.1 hypothetical protein [Bradyrhizobiaceae bacterium]